MQSCSDLKKLVSTPGKKFYTATGNLLESVYLREQATFTEVVSLHDTYFGLLILLLKAYILVKGLSKVVFFPRSFDHFPHGLVTVFLGLQKITNSRKSSSV